MLQNNPPGVCGRMYVLASVAPCRMMSCFIEEKVESDPAFILHNAAPFGGAPCGVTPRCVMHFHIQMNKKACFFFQQG